MGAVLAEGEGIHHAGLGSTGVRALLVFVQGGDVGDGAAFSRRQVGHVCTYDCLVGVHHGRGVIFREVQVSGATGTHGVFQDRTAADYLVGFPVAGTERIGYPLIPQAQGDLAGFREGDFLRRRTKGTFQAHVGVATGLHHAFLGVAVFCTGHAEVHGEDLTFGGVVVYPGDGLEFEPPVADHGGGGGNGVGGFFTGGVALFVGCFGDCPARGVCPQVAAGAEISEGDAQWFGGDGLVWGCDSNRADCHAGAHGDQGARQGSSVVGRCHEISYLLHTFPDLPGMPSREAD